MTDRHVPTQVLELADARQRARQDRDWAEADRLRAEIEAAGWKVVDQATSYRLSPALPPDVVEGGRIRYGSSAAVPSRLEEPRIGLATVVIVAANAGSSVKVVAGLRARVPHETQVVLATDDPSRAHADTLDLITRPAPEPPEGFEPEAVLLRAGSGYAAAANAGIRRARAPLIVLLDGSLELTGDPVGPLVDALDDRTIAVAGAWGSLTSDLRRYADVRSGDADVVTGECLAFRVADYLERGPLDEQLRLPTHLGTWWTLVLRDEGEERPPRRAVCVAGLPLGRPAPPKESSLSASRTRDEKRGFYRVFDRFGHRRDLLSGPRP